MTSLKYELVDGDSETGEIGHFLPSELTNHPSRSQQPHRPSNICVVFVAVITFWLGAITTFFITGVKSHSHPYGYYETGFREEKLSACPSPDITRNLSRSETAEPFVAVLVPLDQSI